MNSSQNKLRRIQTTILEHSYSVILLIPILLALSACQSALPEEKPTMWAYSDLRTLSAEFSENPSFDIVAAYTRESGSDIQIRLDFLDISKNIQSDIYIALDTQPGGTTYLPLEVDSQIYWDTLITLPANGSPVTHLPASPGTLNSKLIHREDVIPRIYIDFQNDYVIISLNKFVFPENDQLFKAQVFLTPVSSMQPVDSIGPFSFDASPQYQLPVLIAFWNVFPAYTPAQALRRWDGAHTGPFGERHGLNLLLQAVKDNEIPVILLDLRAPTSLSALDYIGQLSTIQELADEKLLILPDYIPDTISNASDNDSASHEIIIEWALNNARQISQQFGLTKSNLLFVPQIPSNQPAGYRTIFTLSKVDSKPLRWENSTLIPISSTELEQQATIDGLSLVTRKSLLKSFASGKTDPSNMFILGGSFPESNWGDPESANSTMQYIAEHPWIKPMNIDNIVAMRTYPVLSNSSFTHLMDSSLTPTYYPDVFNPVYFASIENLNNPVFSTASQSYLSLFSPLPPESDLLRDLRKNYFHQIGHLINAAKWAEQPFSLSDCEIDPDNDGQYECVLASEHFYALFEKAGARLIFLFIRIKDEEVLEPDIHQVLGPTSQFLIGMGDPGAWDIEAGEAADSGGIQGAFSDSINSWDLYTPTLVLPDHITFTSVEGSFTKSFTFDDHSLSIEYSNIPPMLVKIPLVLDPWVRFSSDWGDRFWENQITNGRVWGLKEGPEVKITSNGSVTFHSFISSHHTLNERENPNFGYPPGHFIPFPITIAEVETQTDSGSLIIQLDYR